MAIKSTIFSIPVKLTGILDLVSDAEHFPVGPGQGKRPGKTIWTQIGKLKKKSHSNILFPNFSASTGWIMDLFMSTVRYAAL